MTSKEKLDKLLDLQTSLGLNSPSCLCQSPLYKEIYKDLIQQLERLETLELENIYYKSELAGCPNCSKTQEIEKLKNENQILNQNVKDTYDSSQDIIFELQEEIGKLKKFVEILKYYFFIDIIQRETDYKLGFEPVVPIDDQPRFSIITSSDGELVEKILNRKAIVDLCFKDTL